MTSSKKSRLNLELAPVVRERLKELQELTAAASVTEVIRRALALYDHAISSVAEGSTLYLEGKDGERDNLVFLEIVGQSRSSKERSIEEPHVAGKETD